MIKREVGAIKGSPIIYHQCTTQEEMKENGRTAFWVINGEKILDPHEINKRIIQSINDGSYEAQKLTSKKSIKHHSEMLNKEIRKNIIFAIQESMRGCPKEMIPVYQERINYFKGKKIFSENGMVND